METDRADVSGEAGIEDLSAVSGTFADINLDGYSELLLTNGGLVINNGDETFTDRAGFAGFQGPMGVVIPADLDGDGFLDIFNSNLFRSEGYPVDLGRNWLEVVLEGVTSPRDGTGSAIEVVAADMRQAKVYVDGTGRSMGSLPVEFGLDTSQVVQSLIVHWSSGKVQELTDIGVNQVITVIEDTTLVDIGGDGGPGSAALPRVFSLSQNYPNPFNPSTTIGYNIPSGRDEVQVRVVIYDVRGRMVRKLVEKPMEPGRYLVHWAGRDDMGERVSSGIYLYRIEAGEYRAARKMVLVR